MWSKLKRKSLSLHWEFMYTRSMFETPDMIEQHNLLNRVAEPDRRRHPRNRR